MDYYVATNGNDANNGSIGAPFKTLTAARDKIRTLTTATPSANGATELTIAAWAYPTQKGANYGIVSCTSSGTPEYFALLLSGYGAGYPLEFRAKGNGLLAPDYSVPTNQWSHVCGVWKSGQIHKVYINGVEVANNATPPSGTINATDWYAGTDRLISGRYFCGNLKEVRLWTNALSAAQVQALTNDPPTVPPGVVLSSVAQQTFSGAQYQQLNLGVTTPIPGGVNVWLRGGRYPATNNTLTLTAQDTGAAGSPMVYSSYPGEEVIFDGGIPVGPLGFALVADAPTLAKMHVAASNNVYAQTITDPATITLLQGTRTRLSINDRPMTVARYPNIGFGSVNNDNSSGEVINTQGTPGSPVGASFHLIGNYDTNKWSAELGRVRAARVIGYLSADWLRERLRIDSISAAGQVQLMDGTTYGWGNAVARPYIERLLAELDEPGEWYFDNTDNKLYVWPREPLTADTRVRVWNGISVFTLNGPSYLRIQRLTFQHMLNGGTIDIQAGNNNLIAGCTFRNIYGALAFTIRGGTNNGALGCDIIDVDNASTLEGGTVSSNAIIPAGNFIENCHFRQIHTTDMYGKVASIKGAGNIFRHNLMHNHNGQSVTLGGVDHVVELNEIFNTGIEEGDGGSFYQGASASSWGNIFAHNFWHHIMCIPTLHARAPVFSDDGDQGDSCNENVFFKAGEGFKMNQGAGHMGSGNVFLNSIRSVYVLNGTPATLYTTYMNYLNTNATSTAKDNLLGRGLAVFGIAGWSATVNATNWLSQVSPYWYNRYPAMGYVHTNWFNNKAAYKYGWFSNNVYYANSSSAPTGVSVPAQTTVTGGTTLADLNDFVEPGVLNFTWKTPLPGYAADIPFDQIGLYLDEYRTNVPNKDLYRGIVADHWRNSASAGSEVYSPGPVNARIYFNTGRLIEQLGAVPSLPPVTPATVLADSVREWQGTSPQPQQGDWQYGYYDEGTHFAAHSTTVTYSDWIGGGGIVWTRSGNPPQIGQYSMAPDVTYPAVRRWTSRFDGRLGVTVEARRLQSGGNGQTVELRANGLLLASFPLANFQPHHVARTPVDVRPGDSLDVVVRAQGDASSDWTEVEVRIDNLHTTEASRLAYWAMDETGAQPAGNGGSAYDRRNFAADYSGNDRHAQLSNMNGRFVWRAGRLGDALYFNGIDNYATVTNLGVGNGATELTLALWFNPELKGDNRAMISSTGTDYFALLLSGYGGGNPVEFRAKGVRLTGPDSSAPAGLWTHAAGVWKSGQIQKLYLNGIEVASNPTPPAGAVNLSQWILGSDRLLADRNFGGGLDDVVIYDRALSAGEVLALYTNGMNGYNAGQQPADANDDGLPDDWQVKYFGVATAPAAAPSFDADGDGLDNVQEWRAGTIPTNAVSALRVVISSVTAADHWTVNLQWAGVFGRKYQVERTASLTENWTTLPGIIPAVTPLTSTVINSNGVGGFYRVKLQ